MSKQKILKEIWDMSAALCDDSVETSDVTRSNYESLRKINQYCARKLNKLNKHE